MQDSGSPVICSSCTLQEAEFKEDKGQKNKKEKRKYDLIFNFYTSGIVLLGELPTSASSSFW